ncbi:sugar-specific transcriptional regulator TrmB [Halohasta litchfieldiae]|jgi:sugar-specific transcriptional regulator TrmB|uniref:Sugar-specific transcriptional regulator TrmB n=1 Tax=Halohasta litchfieldiae TaxID=1073996 RepID=A0A1H6WC84_9EURY|nr:helix-turn-helix domain-containing protein [Halohasta litchfieldiae]ATW88167.1 sugar-specific transcriptional regulator TrmB [Halohasta litchfieldiae]SEJ10162.1 Sugar-specific transcriptional regulator TrmB [Halohasta litchfieldiae]
METVDNIQEAVEILQQLGLKEYEAQCFVGLSQVPSATAKKISEITDVPRTRVYDAVRVLESKGLVEIQHSSPQRFRAVSLSEATETLRDQYDARVDRLHDALDSIQMDTDADESSIQEIWSMTGSTAIEQRTNTLLSQAETEIVFVIADESLFTDPLVAKLNETDQEVDLLVGAASESVRTHVQDVIPRATTFVSGLEWLQEDDANTDETAIGRLVLVDRSTILVSSIVPSTGEEQAIFGEGFGNGLVVIARRLMSQGQFTADN